MRATRLGVGALIALRAGGEGVVVATFPRACYVSLPAGLIALVVGGVPAGPIHVVVNSELAGVRRGAPARVVDGDLEIDGLVVGLANAEPWRGPLPPPAELAAHVDVLRTATRGASGSALLSDPYRARADRARELLGRGALEDAARLLVGVGPGLTPSGDDALAGIVFAIRATAGPGVESLTTRAAEAGTTGAISRGFLRWAARGQALEPAHHLLVSATDGDAEGAARSARRMAGMGETSGVDVLLGLRWGIEAVPQVRRSAPLHNRR